MFVHIYGAGLRLRILNSGELRAKLESGGCSSMVEQKPSKLTTRVRFPSPAPGIVLAVIDVSIIELKAGRQLAAFRRFRPCSSVVEHSLGKGEVTSSILVMG